MLFPTQIYIVGTTHSKLKAVKLVNHRNNQSLTMNSEGQGQKLADPFHNARVGRGVSEGRCDDCDEILKEVDGKLSICRIRQKRFQVKLVRWISKMAKN